MVKSKIQPVKGPPSKRNAAKQHAVSSPVLSSSKTDSVASSANKGRAKAHTGLPMCVECSVIIGDDIKALQCERCVSEVWKCAHCLGLSDDFYEHLVLSSKCNLHWFCDKCEEALLNSATLNERLVASVDGLQSRSESHEQKLLSSLSDTEDKFLNKIADTDQRFLEEVKSAEDVENVLLKSIEDRLMKLEARPTGIEEVQQRLEHKVDQLRTNMDEPVTLAVQGALQQDKAEELEIEKRKANVIVHGIPESQDDSSDQRITDDMAQLSVMFHEAGVDSIKVENAVRLGRKPADSLQHPRPMKVELDSVENKVRLLKNAKNLRERERKEVGREFSFTRILFPSRGRPENHLWQN